MFFVFPKADPHKRADLAAPIASLLHRFENTSGASALADGGSAPRHPIHKDPR
ncbi:hypothetical protein [Mesobacterium pallidum]|uniref:hypothetical protein n=1 Tax=Mesobacterium pallidum TaxID=2872037 RepID=UPI001EE34E94|nr:hypothetical protein [Mesobacterium pallidum]